MKVCYRELKRWKYQTTENFQVTLPELVAPSFAYTRKTWSGNTWTIFSWTEESKTLYVTAGYQWDGPSGPTLDSQDTMRGSMVHDVLYQAIRLGFLAMDHRETADLILRRICCEDGMGAVRAWVWFEGVRRFAGYAARPRFDQERSVTYCVGLDDA